MWYTNIRCLTWSTCVGIHCLRRPSIPALPVCRCGIPPQHPRVCCRMCRPSEIWPHCWLGSPNKGANFMVFFYGYFKWMISLGRRKCSECILKSAVKKGSNGLSLNDSGVFDRFCKTMGKTFENLLANSDKPSKLCCTALDLSVLKN